MSFITNIMKNLRLNQEDDYDLDEDFEFDDEYRDEEPQRPSLFSKKAVANEDADDYDEDEQPRPRLFGGKTKSTASSVKKPSVEVTMIKPSNMDDSRVICDYLLEGKAVVLNMEGLHMEVAQRIIDFTSGSVYAIGGDLQKISSYIFIASPDNVELSGDFQNMLSSGADLNVSGLSFRV